MPVLEQGARDLLARVQRGIEALDAPRGPSGAAHKGGELRVGALSTKRSRETERLKRAHVDAVVAARVAAGSAVDLKREVGPDRREVLVDEGCHGARRARIEGLEDLGAHRHSHVSQEIGGVLVLVGADHGEARQSAR